MDYDDDDDDENSHIKKKKPVAEQVDTVNGDPTDKEHKTDTEEEFLGPRHSQLLLGCGLS